MQLHVLDSRSHLFLVELELLKVIKIEQHGYDQTNQEADSPQIWVLSLIVLKHDQAFTMTQLVLLDELGIVCGYLLVFRALLTEVYSVLVGFLTILFVCTLQG